MAYDRYRKFTKNGKMKYVPFIEIPRKSTDIYICYQSGKTRLDMVSYNYYQDPNFDWLILQANPEFPPYEFMIPNGKMVRIPYPLDQTLIQFEKDIDDYEKLYGLEEEK